MEENIDILNSGNSVHIFCKMLFSEKQFFYRSLLYGCILTFVIHVSRGWERKSTPIEVSTAARTRN
jgi:hypothetical protein